jgi:hypothetical protein
MQRSVERYADHLRGPYGWMLGRFIAPCQRLDELSEVTRPRSNLTFGPRSLDAVSSGDLEMALSAIDRFNRPHETASDKEARVARIDGLEIQVDSVGEVHRIAGHVLSSLRIWFAITPGPDFEEMLSAAIRMGNSAILHLDGHTEAAPPDTAAIAAFLLSSLRTGVFCKIRHRTGDGSRPRPGLTNLVLGAAVARDLVMRFRPDREIVDTVARLLDDTDPHQFLWQDDGVTWRELRVTSHAIDTARRWFARRAGPSSFDAAVSELHAFGIV